MKQLIINADDFGLSPGINRGVIKAFREGILSSTTMLVNMPGFEESVTLAQENPDLSVGIHLNLSWGRPTAKPDKVSSLVDGKEHFSNSVLALAVKSFLGKVKSEEIELEFRNQIEKFLATGLKPTHLDTHKHIHCLGNVLCALLKVAEEFNIRKIRYSEETKLDSVNQDISQNSLSPSLRTICKRNIVKWLCVFYRSRLEKVGFSMPKHPDHFIGIDIMDTLNVETMLSILKNLPNGTTEIMCHPGYLDEQTRQFSKIPPNREIELESLCHPSLKEYIQESNIKLVSYKDL